MWSYLSSFTVKSYRVLWQCVPAHIHNDIDKGAARTRGGTVQETEDEVGVSGRHGNRKWLKQEIKGSSCQKCTCSPTAGTTEVVNKCTSDLGNLEDSVHVLIGRRAEPSWNSRHLGNWTQCLSSGSNPLSPKAKWGSERQRKVCDIWADTQGGGGRGTLTGLRLCDQQKGREKRHLVRE